MTHDFSHVYAAIRGLHDRELELLRRFALRQAHRTEPCGDYRFGPRERDFWHQIGCVLTDETDDRHRLFDALRRDAEDTEEIGEIVDEGLGSHTLGGYREV